MAPNLRQILTFRRDEIVARFVTQVERKDLSPPGVARSFLVDHIPRFLDEIATELAAVSEVRFSHDAVDTSMSARLHGEQRWSLGYDLDALIREYGILRHAILEVAKEAEARLSIDEVDVLSKCLSVGVAEAATSYGRFRDDQLTAEKARLQFLAEAGQLLSSSLDYRSTLGRLTRLVVPRLGDWCAVHLDGNDVDDMPLAHVDAAKIEVLREIYRNHMVASESSVAYLCLAKTGEAQLVSDVDPMVLAAVTKTPEHLALLRTLDTCSWIVVPLRVQGNALGSLTLAYSDSRRHYGEHDLVMAKELATRAAIAIDNARLYELSQTERSRVEAATRAKDEFVAMVSHELRSPLNAILGWLRLFRNGALPESKREHALDVIERNAKAQGQLVADLIDVSRVIAGKVRIALSQIDLGDVVDMAIEGVRPAADAKRIRLETDIDRRRNVMRGDADRLGQVAWNLLTNAVKFTPKGGWVKVGLRRVDSDLELVVEDNGAGIAKEFLPHVFESFRQADMGTSRSYGGLGIGLSIVKHIVELHGGAVRVESRGEGQGAMFVVRLPVSPLISTTMGVRHVPATTQKKAAFPLPSGAETIRVLVVDDEPDARELVAYVLEESGLEVRVAGSALEAVKELETYSADVIISDIGMPDEDGYSLIRKIRTTEAERKNLPAIALTAFARSVDRTRALVEGFNLYMSKPVEPSALVNAVVDLAGHVRR
jgi:signal transduction histidine kinase/ActR/RegA family two-component response regulator